MNLRLASAVGTWLAAMALASATVVPARAADGNYTYHVVHHFSKKADGKNFPRTLFAGVVVASNGALYGVSQYGGRHGVGTVYRISPETGEVTVLHEFGKTATDGQYPVAQLIEQPDGHVIGSTAGGGEFGKGMVYRMHPEGHIEPLHHFNHAKTGGKGPSGPPVLATDGWRYGVTGSGGTRDAGTIYRLGPSGEFELLYSFDGRYRGDGQYPRGPLVQAPDGWLYGITAEGGENSRGTLFRISMNGSYEKLHDFNNGQAGTKPRSPLMLASDGFLYGATGYGAGYGYGAIYRVRPGAHPEGVHAIDPSTDGLRVTGTPAEAPDGYLYFMLAWAPRSGAVREAPLLRMDRGTGTAQTVGQIHPRRIGQEILSPPALGPDGSFYGTTLLPTGGVVFRFRPMAP